jgi:hypothetical protein
MGVNRRLALVPVARISGAGVGPVWNLQVQGQPEYLANGVLVHNCVQALWIDRIPRDLKDIANAPQLVPVQYADVVGGWN